MSSRLTAGGYALIINSVHLENIGRTVKLISYYGYGNNISYGYCDDLWVVEPDDLVRTKGSLDFYTMPAKNLMPLGDEESKKQFEKEKELENA